MQKPFDYFIMVDWSAASVRNTGKDSIWLADNIEGNIRAVNCPTRHDFFATIKPMLAEALNQGKRTLCGFDFCFGFPMGAVSQLRKSLKDKSNGEDWQFLWSYLHDNITDDDKNRNNRWQVASEINRWLSGSFGPFWGFQGKDKPAYLQPTKDKSITGGAFDELRLTERCVPQDESKTAMFSVWQLSGAGAVGGQSLLGIAYLQRLRLWQELEGKVGVFPFENCDEAPIVFAESYYGRSTLPIDKNITPKDKAQVMAAVEYCRDLQADGRLGALLSRPDIPSVLHDEGWTFTEPKPDDMALLPQMPFESSPKKKSPKPQVLSPLPVMTPKEIYAQSFADIKRLTGITGSGLSDKIRRRMIHACGDIEIADDIIISGNLQSALRRLKQPSHIISDCNMVAEGLIKSSLPPKARVISAIAEVGVRIPKAAIIPTRSAMAMEKIADKLADSIIIIGNAPTALERLLYGVRAEGWQKPALIIATPVGFVGAAESKESLQTHAPVDYITLRGRKGGSAIAAAAFNAIALHLQENREHQHA